MGKEKQTSEQQQTAAATEEEKELQRLEIERTKATQPGMISAQTSGLNLINMLLSGQEPLPGFFNQMSQGISPQAIGTQATQLMRQNLPQYQSMGLLDSGTMMQGISRDIANQLLFPAEQFNIGAKQNLLNLALSGQAQVQQPMLSTEQTMSQRLAGLRPQAGTQTITSPKKWLWGAF